MKRIVCLLVVICIMLPLIVVQVGASEQDAVEYITNNVDILPSIYRHLHPDSDNEFAGTYVEFSLPVTVVSSGEVGTYLDFDGNNGYMVIVNGNDVIKWEVSGDLEFMKELDRVYYSVTDGFGYYGENFVAYDVDDDLDTEMVPGSAYNGQVKEGEGAITDINAYMIDRYSSQYVLSEIDFLSGSFEYAHTADYSIYNEVNSQGVITGYEGNCTLTAIYAAMNYLQMSNKCPTLPASSARVIHYAEYDPFFEEYDGDDGYSIINPITLPVLYYTIRHRAIDNNYYERYGMNAIYMDDVIMDVSTTYNAGIATGYHALGSFENYVKPKITQNLPIILSVSNSVTYNSHAMVVNGYRVYEKTTTIMGIDFKDYVTLLRVSDGWGRAARFFDWTAFKGTWAFITMEVN